MDCMLCVHSNKLVCNKKGSGTKKKPIEKKRLEGSLLLWPMLVILFSFILGVWGSCFDGGLYVYTLPETNSEFAPEN